MADVITRFKLETTQYDSKLRDASKNLADLTHHLSMAGKDFENFAKNHVQTAASLGQVASGATNLKDKLKDLVGAYNTAARAYNSLAKDQQSGDFGKAMAASLQKLQQDITQTKNELYNIGEQSKGTGGIMDMLAQKMTVNIDAARLFELGLSALKSVLGTLKDAFFNNEEQLDEWGRIVESSHSLYNGFLNALNTGDISGYLKNIANITQAARDAYDALDALGTFNAFNQINVERARTNMTESIADYRGGSGSKEAVKVAGDAYKKELEDRKRLEKDAYISAVKKTAAERGVSAKDLMDALSGNYGHYQDLKNVMPSGVGQRYVPGLPGMPGSYREYSFAQNDRERLGEALRHLNDTELQSLQALGAQAERTGNEIATVDKQLTRVLNGRQSGSSGGNVRASVKDTVFPKGSVAQLNKEIQQLRDEQSKVTNPYVWQDYEDKIKSVTNQIKEMKGELGLEALRGMKGVSVSDGVQLPTRESILKKGDAAIRNFKAPTEKSFPETLKGMDQLLGSVNTITSSLQELGIDVPEGFTRVLSGMQTVVTILEAIQTINAVGSILGIFSNGGVVKAAGGYRVPGRTFSGDMVPARLNAGELVLNQAQAGIIANALQDRDFSGGVSLQPYVEGERVYLGMENTLKRKGKGEIVTTSTLRQLGLI